MNKIKIVLVSALIIFLISAVTAHAARRDSSSWGAKKKEHKEAVSSYDQGVEASKNKDFKKALRLFEQALREDKNNPDILNMLAHTQLKLGLIDESLDTYNRALRLRPRFPEAREYLGEAYIHAALREIDILKSYGSEGAESLEDLVKAFKEAVAEL